MAFGCSFPFVLDGREFVPTCEIKCFLGGILPTIFDILIENNNYQNDNVINVDT